MVCRFGPCLRPERSALTKLRHSLEGASGEEGGSALQAELWLSWFNASSDPTHFLTKDRGDPASSSGSTRRCIGDSQEIYFIPNRGQPKGPDRVISVVCDHSRFGRDISRDDAKAPSR